MTMLTFPAELSAGKAAKPKSPVRIEAEEELPPLWVLLLLPLVLLLIPAYLGLRKLTKALQRRS